VWMDIPCVVRGSTASDSSGRGGSDEVGDADIQGAKKRTTV
jgi:hypothetical protein